MSMLDQLAVREYNGIQAHMKEIAAEFERVGQMIEVDKRLHRGVCSSYFTNGACRVGTKRSRHGRYVVCTNCPVWRELDVLYENITGREVEQTYDWWREEWIEYGLPYALERMTDHVPENEPVIATGYVDPRIYVWNRHKPFALGLDQPGGGLRLVGGIAVVIVLLFSIQALILVWI